MQNNMAKLKKDTESLMNDRKAAKANVRFSSVEKIDEEFKKLLERQETTSMSLSEEKRIWSRKLELFKSRRIL
jgi:hypothetical protein